MAKFKVGDRVRSLEECSDIFKGGIYIVTDCYGGSVYFNDSNGDDRMRPSENYELVNDNADELAELRAWRDAAIVRFPELGPVDPDEQKAIELTCSVIDIGQYGPKGIDGINTGHWAIHLAKKAIEWARENPR